MELTKKKSAQENISSQNKKINSRMTKVNGTEKVHLHSLIRTECSKKKMQSFLQLIFVFGVATPIEALQL